MKKTNFMVSEQARKQLKQLRTGMLMLVMLVVFGLSSAFAQTLDGTPVNQQGNYVSSAEATAIFTKLHTQEKPFMYKNMDSRFKLAFYEMTLQKLDEGLSLENALNWAEDHITSRVMSNGMTTAAAISQIRDEAEDAVRD